MNNIQHQILHLLADGECHSGESIGESLGVSRAAVWKQLKNLESLGVGLSSRKGAGYSLDRQIIFLDESKILSGISPELRAHLLGVEVSQSIASTNQALLEEYAGGADIHGRVMLAEHQQKGRGRRGRTWESPYGSNIYLSMGWCFTEGVSVLEGLSLALGVGICRVLEGLGVTVVKLKWPNDLLIDDRKLGGILLELSGDASGDCGVVIGMGLNVNMPKAQEIDQPWIDLSTATGMNWDRNVIVASIIDQCLSILVDYPSNGFSYYREEWESLNAFSEQAVSIISGNFSASGICKGVTEAGGLKVDCDGEEKIFLGGEVSLRKV